MALADLAQYVAIFGEIGIVPMAVTTTLSINFLHKPSGKAAVVAVCKLMKVGKTLAVGEVSPFSEGDDDPVAHVVGRIRFRETARSSNPVVSRTRLLRQSTVGREFHCDADNARIDR